MKYVAIVMVLVLVLALVGVGWLYFTANVSVDAVGVIAVEASTQSDYFDSLKDQLNAGHLSGTVFSTDALGNAADYQFYTYTVRLSNNSAITADMVEMQVTPMAGDVLQVGDTTPKALNAHTTGDIQATILTPLGMHSVRELTVTYYVWGIPFSIKTAYGK